MSKIALKRIGIIIILLVGAMATAQTSKMADVIDEFRADTRGLRHIYIMEESEEYYQRFSTFYDNWMNR